MKSGVKWGVLGLLVYCIFLIAKLPAVHVINNLTLPPQLSINGVSGSIWQGQANRINYAGLPFENVTWSLSPLSLLVGSASLDLKAGNARQSDNIAVNGKVSVSASSLQAQQLTAYIPADLMMLTLPLPIPVDAQGRFKIQLDEVDYDFAAGCNELNGKGQWLNARVAGMQSLIDFGNFDADISCAEQNVKIAVSPQNSLGLDAEVTIPANLKFSVNGKFKPNPSLPQEVHQAALFFGKPDSSGFIAVKF